VGEPASRNAAAVERLDEITRRLRRECPWDREQDERSIVPHTVEEAYELAEAAERGDDSRLLDELGDVLFQVHFLALLLEERGAGDLAAVADLCREKLIRRHPHVFGTEQGGRRPAAAEAEPSTLTASDVLRNWDRIKREQEGRGDAADPFAEVPENLPALLYARKLQRRAASAGLAEPDAADAARVLREAADDLAGLLEQGESAAPDADRGERTRVESALGELLFAAVDVARRVRADPELALRAQARQFRDASP
jgi:MazG family protein